MTDLFVDTHCHLFNIVDIPLYDTLMGKVEMGTLKRLVAGFGVGAIVSAGMADNLLDKNQAFIRFFERSIERNIIWLAGQVKEAVPESRILLVPLVMDFDLIHSKSRGKLTEPKVLRQLDRLIHAVEITESKCENVKICPFMGYDLRKLEQDGGLDRIKADWDRYGSRGRGFGDLASGTVLGIKLYPPIGFNPYPEEGQKPVYEAFYRWCTQERIPLTTHCQNASGSYSAGLRKKEVNRLTHARNWWRLFREFPPARDLCINFAHFGGEDGLEDMIDWTVDKSSWTYYLVKLLKKYDNTYSDISAFDFSDKEACRNLKTVFEMDQNGEFDDEGDHLLKDKLLWGSDVPMIISGAAYHGGDDSGASYGQFYSRFVETVGPHDHLTGKNPIAFLGLG